MKQQQWSQRYENILITLMFLTFGTIFLDRMAQFYLAPYIIPDLHVSNEQLGMMASALGIAWALSCVFFGAISDRVGRRRILIPAVFAFSALSWLSGVVHSFGAMLAVRFVLGIAEGACYSPLMATTEESSSDHRRGRNVGLVVSSAALVGTAVAPILTTQVAAHIGWRWSFFVAGVPGMILGVVIWWYVKESKGRRAGVETRPNYREFWSLLRYRNVLLCALAASANLTGLFLYAVFAPLYITQVAHQAPTTAGFLMGAGGSGAFIAGFVLPALSDKVGRKPVLAAMAVASMLLPISLLPLGLYQHLYLLAFLQFIFSTSQAITSVVLVLIPTESVPAKFTATAIAVGTMTAEIVGSTIGPALGGVIAGVYGLEPTLVMSSLANVVVLGAVLCLIETRGRRARPAAVAAA
jgi:predicted MFS family arabinose efflux permease